MKQTNEKNPSNCVKQNKNINCLSNRTIQKLQTIKMIITSVDLFITYLAVSVPEMILAMFFFLFLFSLQIKNVVVRCLPVNSWSSTDDLTKSLQRAYVLVSRLTQCVIPIYHPLHAHSIGYDLANLCLSYQHSIL